MGLGYRARGVGAYKSDGGGVRGRGREARERKRTASVCVALKCDSGQREPCVSSERENRVCRNSSLV